MLRIYRKKHQSVYVGDTKIELLDIDFAINLVFLEIDGKLIDLPVQSRITIERTRMTILEVSEIVHFNGEEVIDVTLGFEGPDVVVREEIRVKKL